MNRRVVACGLLLLGACQFDEGGTGLMPPPGLGNGPGPVLRLDARAPAMVVDAPAYPPPPDAGLPPPPAIDARVADAPAPAPAPPPAGPDAMPAAPAVPGCPDDPDLIVCLRFEGRTVDESPARLPIMGQPLGYAPGTSGQAAQLGPGGHLTIAETPILDSEAITLEASVRPAELGRTMTVVENPGQYGLVITDSGGIICGAGSNGQLYLSTGIRAGVWTRLHCVLQDGRITLWINGNLTATAAAGPVNTNRNFGLRVGWDDEPARPYSGLMDDLRVWRAGRPLP